jgi:hypothetical protein
MPNTDFEMAVAKSIRKIGRAYMPRSMGERLGLKMFPIVNTNEYKLQIEQKQMFFGLQQPRAMDGAAFPAKRPGFSVREFDPAPFTDRHPITESNMILERDAGNWMEYMGRAGIMSDIVQQAKEAQYNRMEKNIFDALTSGTIEVRGADGKIYQRRIYEIKKFATPPGSGFDNLSAGYPYRWLTETLETAVLGVSVKFDEGLIMGNRKTVNWIINNANAADFFGRRLKFGQTPNGLDELNDLLDTRDLPKLGIYNEGYYSSQTTLPDATKFTKYLADGQMIWKGKREDGDSEGEYRVCRHASGDDGKGEYVLVNDMRNRTPPQVDIEYGHNGGVCIYHPYAYLSLTVNG